MCYVTCRGQTVELTTFTGSLNNNGACVRVCVCVRACICVCMFIGV